MKLWIIKKFILYIWGFENKIMLRNLFIYFFIGLICIGCSSSKRIVYLQDNNKQFQLKSFETQLQPDDQLLIIVSAENQEVAAPYNLKSFMFQEASELTLAQERSQSYIVDKEGNIEFPILGKIHLAGLTRLEATEKLKNVLKEHVKDPLVTVRLINFKVSVLGEVNKPGVFTVNTDRITLLEAIAQAGDLTIYGKRQNVLVIREINGVKTMQRIDLTSTDFVNSDYYYLHQNDVVYIEPNKTRVNSSVIGPNLTVGISALSLIVTIIALTAR